jgi:hypothetical protein
VTLNLIVRNDVGIWQLSDYRITDLRSGRWVPRGNHYAPKYVGVGLPGVKALITYTGVAEVEWVEPVGMFNGAPVLPSVTGKVSTPGRKRTFDTAEWIAWQLQGARDLKVGTEQIQRAADECRSFHCGTPTIITVTAYMQDSPTTWKAYNWQITNARGERYEDLNNHPPGRSFEVRASNPDMLFSIGNAGYIFLGSGGAAIAPSDRDLLDRVFASRPNNPERFARVLADINRRASQDKTFGHTISRSCAVSFIPVPSLTPTRGRTDAVYSFPNGDPVPPHVQYRMYQVIGGINFSPGLQDLVNTRWPQ